MRHAGRHVAEMGDARRIEQPELGLAAVGVVDANQHDVAQAAGFVLNGLGGDLEDALGTVGSDEIAFVLDRLQALRTGYRLPAPQRRSDALESQLDMTPTDHVQRSLAEVVEYLLIGEDDAAVAVEQSDASAGRLEH